MKIRKGTFRLILFLFLLDAVAGLSQVDTRQRVNYELLKQRLKDEKSIVRDPGDTERFIKDRGLNFLVDDKKAEEMRKDGFPEELISLAKSNGLATVQVSCPVSDCNVKIVETGQTARTFNKERAIDVPPGKINVEVSEPGYEPSRLPITIAAGEVHALTANLLVEKGNLSLACSTNCTLRVSGAGTQLESSAADRKLTTLRLAPGEYSVQAIAQLYKSKTVKLNVQSGTATEFTFDLVPDEWAGVKIEEALNKVLDSLGGQATLGVNSKTLSSGSVAVSLPNGGIPRAQVVEAALLPDKLRWDLKISGEDWSVIHNPANKNKVSSEGKVYRGQPLGAELENSLESFVTLRLPALLLHLKSGFRFKKDVSAEDHPILIAENESSSDRYSIELAADFRPRKVVHEKLTGTRLKTEVEFSDYRAVRGQIVLPYEMTLRYPERKFEQSIKFDKIVIDDKIKDSDFKNGGGGIKALIGK